MWAKVSLAQEKELLTLAISFTGNAQEYGSYMVRVANEWKHSCEHNLTDQSLNKQAWIGHAAASLAHNLPEYIVRRAWGLLTEEQRIAANIKADNAVELWTTQFTRGKYGWQTSFDF